MLIDNKENVESVASSVSQKDVESVKSVKEKFISPPTKTEIEQEKFVSPPSSPPPTKTDIEKIEQRNDRKFSAEIDAISEKLYHMNNMVKMNKDLEVLAKDNLVKSDIMKKLTLKEKWLAENNPANKPVQPVKSKFEEKIDAIKGKGVEKEQNAGENERKLTVEEVLKELKPRTPDFNSSRPSPLASNPLFKKAARENMLDIVKDIDMGKVDMMEGDEDDENKDIGKLLYDIENRMDPMMASKMKEIETKNFAGTMDLIKSQMIEPSTHANANIDLAKYFPNQKQDKISAGATNKNQKNLKDVDLAKYFPTSPQPSRKSSVVTVAEQLKRSSTEKSVPTSDSEKKKVNKDKKLMKRGESFNLRDHQLDGAVDLPIKPKPVKTVTTAATAKSTKKGNVKIIKAKNPKVKKQSVKRVVLSGSDDPDDVLDEIWRQAEEEMGSPSLEYQDLFQEEKSPSEDVSDKLEGILEECGIDMGKKRRKKVTKAKSFAEGDLKYEHENKSFDSACMDEQDFDDEDRPKGVQNILKRFESLRSVKPEETTPQLVRKESTHKSRDSLVSQESVVSLSDLEKTMDYLKSEWRSEATNFLQMKRDKFFGQKRTAEDKKTVSNENLQKKTKTVQKEEPQQSKLASFFGIGAKQKSPEKKTQLQKSPKSSALPIKNDTVKQAKNTEKVNKSPKMKLNTKSSPKKGTFSPKTSNNNAEKVGYGVSLLEDESEKLVSKLEKETSLNNKNDISKASVPITSTLDTTAEVKNKDERTEDIKNLPKTGCDKSQNNSRRGSIQSVGSRRCSYTEKLDDIAKYAQLLSPGTELKSNIDELFDKIVTEFDGENNSSNINNDTQAPTIIETKDEECDSLCTTISKSPSCEGLGVKLRGSSEDRSIENLFSRFTDEMLVNVEFDSNDELLSITPKHTKSVTKSQIPKEFPPEKPPRRSKSSSSSESCIPVAPQRLKKKLSKLSPYDMPPSMQDKRKQIASSAGDKSATNFPLADNSKYDRKEHQDESLKFPGVIKASEIYSDKKEDANIQKSVANRRLSKDSRDSIRQQPLQSTTSPRKMSIETTESKNLVENQSPQKSNDRSATESELQAPITIEVSKEIPNMSSLPLDNDKATALSQKDSETIENVVKEETTPNENLERKKSQTNFDLKELESLGEKRRLIEAKYKERRASRGNTELNETEKLKEDPITSPVINEENNKEPINLVVSKQEKVEKEESNIKNNVNIRVHEKTPAKKSPPLATMEKHNHQQENKKNVEGTNQHKEKNNVEDATVVAHTPVSSLKKPTESIDEAKEQIEYTNKKQPTEPNNKNISSDHSTMKNEQAQKRGSVVSSTGSEMEEYEKLRQRELLVKEKQYPKMEEDNKVQKIQKEQPKEKENSISPEKLIAQFETERRLSLIERDKEYMEKVKIEDWYKPPEIPKSVPPQFEHEKSSSVDTVAEVFKNRQWPDGVTDFTKTEEEPVLEELSPEVEEIKQCSVKDKSSSKEQSMEADMEQVMASPMPRRRTLQPSPEPDTEENKIVKALEQERRQSILEREKLYEERKSSNASTLDTQSLNSLKSIFTSTPQSDDNKMLDLKLQSQSNTSPTGSMNLLNNLAQSQQDMEKQLLRQNEEERRKSLLKREQEYAAKVKPEDLFKVKNGNSNRPQVDTSTDSKISTPSSQSKMSTPLSQSKLSTPLHSKRSSPVREGTPPMLKKLDIVEKTASTTLSSRRPSSTFAMLEHLEKKEPVIAPMPKKLEFPKVVPKYVPEIDDNPDSVAEVFQNRPWPKQELDSEEEEEVLKKEVEEEEKPEIEICYPLPEVFKNRQWPDGVTKYEEKQRANSLEPTQRKTTEVKSFAEIMKKPVGHDSVQSLPQTTAHSSRSSAESDYGFARPQFKTGNRAESIDASTRILLSRGKHLHDRKCDFLSDQQKADRYKRPAVSAEDRLNVDDDNLLSYRPRSYAGTTRFPSSSDLSRRNRYDYLGTSSSYAPISDYSSSSRIPSSSVGLGYHVPTVTSSGLSSAHLTDYYRRSPSRHQSRDTSIRDSCVIL